MGIDEGDRHAQQLVEERAADIADGALCGPVGAEIHQPAAERRDDRRGGDADKQRNYAGKIHHTGPERHIDGVAYDYRDIQRKSRLTERKQHHSGNEPAVGTEKSEQTAENAAP